MGLSEQYKTQIETMTIDEAKREYKKIQAYIDEGGFDNMWEASFQYTKLNILKEKFDIPETVSETNTVVQPVNSKPVKTSKRKWRFWK